MKDALRIMKEIADTHRALAKLDAGKFRGKPVYRSTPACDRACPKCDIACAVLTGILADLEQEAATAIASPPSAGSFIVYQGGRA